MQSKLPPTLMSIMQKRTLILVREKRALRNVKAALIRAKIVIPIHVLLMTILMSNIITRPCLLDTIVEVMGKMLGGTRNPLPIRRAVAREETVALMIMVDKKLNL